MLNENLSITIKDKKKFKKDVQRLLSEIIDKPNKNVCGIWVAYDPNLDIVTLKCNSLNGNSQVIFDEPVDK